MAYTPHPWMPEDLNRFAQKVVSGLDFSNSRALSREINNLAGLNKRIHEQQCINLNPATNIMNPRAEALLASGLGTRPSLGYPGDKYEMGLEAIEQIEVIASQLACEIFNTKYAEIRVGSGALGNLYSFMASCRAGDSIIVPPASIGGHVTHHDAGAAGLFGLNIHHAVADTLHYTVDLEQLRKQAQELRPRLITIATACSASTGDDIFCMLVSTTFAFLTCSTAMHRSAPALKIWIHVASTAAFSTPALQKPITASAPAACSMASASVIAVTNSTSGANCCNSFARSPEILTTILRGSRHPDMSRTAVGPSLIPVCRISSSTSPPARSVNGRSRMEAASVQAIRRVILVIP